MAQGKLTNLKKKPASGGAQKKKAVQPTSKGKKHFSPKGRKATIAVADREITKSINKKNEVMVSTKAVSSGGKFFLTDIREGGQQALEKQLKAREKKESKGNKNMDIRLKEQLKSLGR